MITEQAQRASYGCVGWSVDDGPLITGKSGAPASARAAS